MHLYGLYNVTKLNDTEVRITEKNRGGKIYKYTSFIQDGDALDLTLKQIKCLFEFDHAEKRYYLIGIENLRQKKGFVVSIIFALKFVESCALMAFIRLMKMF